jgi:flagellar basal-body rod protein FlgF
MDRSVYISVSGAQQSLYAQAVNNHNLANATTPGFRQALAYAFSKPMDGPVYDTRTYVQMADETVDFNTGPLQTTGRDLDIAIQGDGFFVVQAADGTEGYTRSGHFQLDSQGRLLTDAGLPVLGDGGPIAIPPAESLAIGADGTITIRPLGSQPNALAALERIRLVNPDVATLTRSADGLFRTTDGVPAVPDANVRVVSGMLEGSNVNTVSALANMIELTRHYETQVNMMSQASKLGQQTNRLLGIG